MTGFLLLRLGRAVVTVLLVMSFSFLVLRLSGDPAQIIMSPDAPPAAIAAFRRAWGLDDPLWLQYVHYFGAAATGELGQSMRDGRPALPIVMAAVPATLALTVPALVLKAGFGIPAGIAAALRRGSRADRALMALSVAGFTVPSFVLGLVLVLVFSVGLRLLPTGGYDGWRSAVLPVLTLGVGGAAILARFTRSAMLEVLNQPYMRTASAKGLAWSVAVRRHALPNAAMPTVTILGFMVGSLIGGAVVVENVFAWPGVGRLLVLSVASRDLAVVQCILLLVAVTMVGSNLAVDLVHGLLDPRVRGSAR